MGKKGTLIEFKNLRKVVYRYIENRNDFYLSEEMVKYIFKEYQEEILSRPYANPQASNGQKNKFKNIEHRGERYLRIQIAKIINYTKDFNCKKRRGGGASHYERIIN
tara:strand:- start:5288 stop:5608 length:321 start_codon:yes stop_codon:yes gene_type:complete